jgi:hypothetical protein
MFGFSPEFGHFLGNLIGEPKFGLDRQVKNASMWTALTGQAPAPDSLHLDPFRRLRMFRSVGHST